MKPALVNYELLLSNLRSPTLKSICDIRDKRSWDSDYHWRDPGDHLTVDGIHTLCGMSTDQFGTSPMEIFYAGSYSEDKHGCQACYRKVQTLCFSYDRSHSDKAEVVVVPGDAWIDRYAVANYWNRPRLEMLAWYSSYDEAQPYVQALQKALQQKRFMRCTCSSLKTYIYRQDRLQDGRTGWGGECHSKWHSWCVTEGPAGSYRPGITLHWDERRPGFITDRNQRGR